MLEACSSADAVSHSLSRTSRFQPDTQGILLSVSRCSVPKSGVIGGLSPFVHFSVTVQGLMYSPRVGGIVPLKLEFVSEGHLSGLVLGVFNASLPADLLPAGCTFDAAKEEWTVPGSDDAPARSLASGSLVYMRISDLGVAGGSVSLTGTLLTPAEAEAHKAKHSKAAQKAAATPVRQGGVKRRLEDTPASQPEGGAAAAEGGSASAKKAKKAKSDKAPAKKARKEKKSRKE